jgi:hypothetical protein
MSEQQRTEQTEPQTAETHINYDKLVLYYQFVTRETADALETLIEQASVFLPTEEIEAHREVLDHAREHLAGWNGPIRWLTEAEAQRYIEQENNHGRTGQDFKLLKIEGGINVFVPK